MAVGFLPNKCSNYLQKSTLLKLPYKDIFFNMKKQVNTTEMPGVSPETHKVFQNEFFKTALSARRHRALLILCV
ncbi:hypothetical protein AM493_07830 [Flavobacterium akiainvivens]|uniref:Uncharacterized protein n=1 Tax=Flavobacterium akiainvivens TaxID=1202724 RepID=A0A0M8MAE9_9FLAO|nr:hypothetical protein AM493_07830 [Flavobacterium akiainvivens]